jgi:spermidine synthase
MLTPQGSERPSEKDHARHPAAVVAQVQILLFVSGFSALLLEVVYVKLLRYWVGNTAYSVAAVLCAYMTGLAAGSFAAGKWLVRWRRLLAVYGCMELIVGLYSAGLPWTMGKLEPAYLSLTRSVGPDSHLALVGHFMGAVTLLLLPTFLMGATYPVVVRAASQATADSPDVAEKLYYANLAGAALGTLLSDFLLLRFWGLGNTLILVAVINSLLAASAILLQRRQPAAAETEAEGPAHPSSPPRIALAILLVSFWGGFLVLFLEMVWTSMVGRFLDSTVYAFAVTLFAVIAGLGAGAAIVNRQLARRTASQILPYPCLGAGLLVMLLIPFWDRARILAGEHPAGCVAFAFLLLGAVVFAVDSRAKALVWYGAATWGLILAVLLRRRLDPPGSQFWILHGVDFSVSAIFMVGPAVLMGMVFPLVLRGYLAESGKSSLSVGPVYALNTVGCLAGILAATFLLLPSLGVERSGRLVGLGFFILGLALLCSHLTSRRWALALALLLCVAWVQYVPHWDFTRTLHYLDHTGDVVYEREDLNAGFTTVLHDGEDWYIFVNDLFNGGTSLEERDQARIAVVPLLYAHEFERAMVIGIGTGETAGIVGQYPFKHIDIVDFSPRVVEAAEQFFPMLNFGVFKDPRVKVHVDDGRHYLLTHPAKLSLLTVQVNRLWTAGEGDLYTREFYETCSARLSDQGVMQQWVPLFSLSIPETLIIIRTVRQVFPQVALYVGGGSGMIVASRSPLELDYARLRAMDANHRVAAMLDRIDLPSAASLLGDLVLKPEGVDALLARASEGRISTDLWPYLEHSNARYHVGKTSGIPLWQFLLNAEPFQVPPLAGANQTEWARIRKAAADERQSQFENLDEH